VRRGPALGLAAGAFIAGIVMSAILGGIAYAITGDLKSPLTVAGGFIGLWLPMIGAAMLASWQFGSKSPVRDLGLRFVWSDLWRGPLVGVAGMIASILVQLALSPFPRLVGSNTGFIEEQTSTLAGVVVVVSSTMIGAPLVEELFFRGLVQRSLVTIGLWGVLIQAVIFGLIHFTPEAGLGNVSVMLGVGAFGFVQGLAARRFGRLGPCMLAHALFNTIAVLPILLK
jgi:uncharacterized protein